MNDLELFDKFLKNPVKIGDRKFPKRHGYEIKCSCGVQHNLGGIRNGHEYFSALSYLRNLKEEHKKHDLKIEHSYHAAELAHASAIQTTNQTKTGDQNWTDISGVSLSNTNFTDGRKYLIMCTAFLSSSSTTHNVRARIVQGSTEIGETEVSLEFDGTASITRWPYFWMEVYAPTGGQGANDVKMQFKVDNNGTTIRADNITLFAIEISEDLTENTDWWWNKNLTDTAITTTASSSNNAEVTATLDSTKDYLIYTTDRCVGTNTSTSLIHDTRRDSTVISNLTSAVFDDTTNDIRSLGECHIRVGNDTSATYKSTVRTISTSAHTRIDSRIFILDLSVFKDIGFSQTITSASLTATTWTELQTVTKTSSQAGDVCAMITGTTTNYSVNEFFNIRLQIDNSDDPATQTSDAYELGAGSGNVTGIAQFGVIAIGNQSAASHDYDMDYQNGSGDTGNINNRSVLMFSLELAGAPAGFAHSQGCVIG